MKFSQQPFNAEVTVDADNDRVTVHYNDDHDNWTAVLEVTGVAEVGEVVAELLAAPVSEDRVVDLGFVL